MFHKESSLRLQADISDPRDLIIYFYLKTTGFILGKMGIGPSYLLVSD